MYLLRIYYTDGFQSSTVTFEYYSTFQQAKERLVHLYSKEVNVDELEKNERLDFRVVGLGYDCPLTQYCKSNNLNRGGLGVTLTLRELDMDGKTDRPISRKV